MNYVIMWTLKQKKLSILCWCIGIVAFVSLELGVYSSIKGQAAELNQALSNLPSSVRSLFGTSDLFSPVGYLNSRIYYFLLPLILSVMTIGLGSSLIAKEESSGTIEHLLGRPISRGRLLLAKAVSGLLISFLVSVVV